MHKKNNKQTLLLLHAGSGITEFEYKNLELDCLCQHFDIIILDLCPLINKGICQKYNKNIYRAEITQIDKFILIFSVLRQIFRTSANSIIIWKLFTVNDFKSLCILIYIKLFTKNKIIFETQASGHPDDCRLNKSQVECDDAHLDSFESIWKKSLFKNASILKKISGKYLSYGSYANKLKNIIIKAMCRVSDKPDYLFVAGDEFISSVEKKRARMTLPFHSYDYSNLLFRHGHGYEYPDLKYAIYTATPGPRTKGDWFLTLKKHPLSDDVWDRALVDFFDQIERAFDLKVIIAAHPKTHPEDVKGLYGGRKVFFDSTSILVKKSSLVISTNSSSVSYAVIYQKPIIFVVSDEMLGSYICTHAANFSKLLGSALINIDHEYKLPVLDVNIRAYAEYQRNYISSASCTKEPNHRLLLKQFAKNDKQDTQ